MAAHSEVTRQTKRTTLGADDRRVEVGGGIPEGINGVVLRGEAPDRDSRSANDGGESAV